MQSQLVDSKLSTLF